MQYTVEVIKENKGYTGVCYNGNDFIAAVGDTFEEMKTDMISALEFTYEPEKVSEEQLKFEYDLESFFDFYRVINAKALSERIGMNQSLLAQYIRGNKKPSPKQVNRILEGVRQIGRELCEVNFLV